ncbi:hypothetical protein [Desulfitobacterium hafniense]|uniref:hypothetical protein n=1 Tax=Desulfitobacterium hafniense TaxID=49338 RepID=UPI00039FAD26|nr:hypothetical protein [Desulfitobacterium hafniense]
MIRESEKPILIGTRLCIAEGKAEVAKKLLDLGFEITKVAEATGLSEKDIKSLKD